MRELKLFVLVFAVGFVLAACGGPEKKVDTVEVPVEAEKIVSVERFWQLNNNDPGVAAEERLLCRYTVYTQEEGAMRRAHIEVKTSGRCDWPSLRHDVGEPNQPVPAQNAAALLAVVDGVELAVSGEPAWDCATMNVKTNQREFFLKDCNLRNRDQVRSEKGFADALGKDPSGSVEEAAFRFNQLLILE